MDIHSAKSYSKKLKFQNEENPILPLSNHIYKPLMSQNPRRRNVIVLLTFYSDYNCASQLKVIVNTITNALRERNFHGD